ncbi:MAG: hypothetical protein HN416_14925 [Nitrospina sp.]|jgi:hypothetical protein|nr:hypothetical protein [Nitrospina sp.]
MERDWSLIEKDFRVSGQSLTAYCREKGLPYSSARKHIDVVPAANAKAAKPKAKKTTWKHDWTQLKQEFLSFSGTLSDFGRERGFKPNDGNFNKNSVGWLDEKAELQRKTVREAKKHAALEYREQFNQHMTDLRNLAANNINQIQQLEAEVLSMDRESPRDTKDAMATIKIKAELIEKTKSILIDFLPIPEAEDGLEANLKKALSHYQETGDRSGYLQIMKLLTGVKTAESSFNWSLFDEKING